VFQLLSNGLVITLLGSQRANSINQERKVAKIRLKVIQISN
jgi:hypothetical protein